MCSTQIHGSNGGAPIDEFNVVDGIIKFVRSQTATFPLAGAASGFTYGDSIKSKSFGSLFVERPLTNGKRAWSARVSFQRTHWTAIDGTPFSDLIEEEGHSTEVTNRDQCRATGTGCPALRWAADFSLVLDTADFGTTFGLRDNLDVSLDVPFGRSTVAGRSFRTGAFSKDTPEGTQQFTTTAKGVAYGFGDVAIRSKYNFKRGKFRLRRSDKVPWSDLFSLSANVQEKLPTGNVDALLGAHKWQTQALLLASATPTFFPQRGFLRFFDVTHLNLASYHATLGYTWAGDGVRISNQSNNNTNQFTGDFSIDLSNEVNWAAGLDFPIVDRHPSQASPPAVTLAFDVVGRTLLHGAHFENVGFIGTTGKYESQPFLNEQASSTLLLASLGLKACAFHDWLISANLLWPLNDNGVRLRPTPTFAAERVFLISGKGLKSFEAKRDGCAKYPWQ